MELVLRWQGLSHSGSGWCFLWEVYKSYDGSQVVGTVAVAVAGGVLLGEGHYAVTL